MCMIDNGDGLVTVLYERHPVAKKEHKCNECHRAIPAGEKYLYETYVWDGKVHTHKTCRHCQVVRKWLLGECSGFLYGAIAEDIHEHAQEGYGVGVKMLAIGIYKKWKRRDGNIWRIPSVPKFSAPPVRDPNEGTIAMNQLHV